MPILTILAIAAVGCHGSTDGTYCACPEHGKPKRCVDLALDGDEVSVEMKVDGATFGSEKVKYEVDSGYGKATTRLGPLRVTLGPGVLGVGPSASAVYIEGDAAGVYAHSQMLRDYTCK